jgi:DNA-binding NarL/FixJ family response regulator
VKVLVIDDAARVRERVVAMLSAIAGVTDVVEAASTAEALAALRRHAPNVVVLDLHLRGESGLALAPLVKREIPGALLLAVTNQPSEQLRRQCLALGADRFFDKAREFDALARAVASAVDGFGA